MQKSKLVAVQIMVALASGVSTLHVAAEGYAVSSDKSVVRNNFGDCWRTGAWQKGDQVEGCDGYKKAETPKPEAPKAAEPVKPAEVAKPAPKPAAPKKLETISLNASSLFAFNKAELTSQGKESLDSVVAILKERGYVADKSKIEVVGHTDRLGKEAYNLKLSAARAAAAKDYMIGKGVDAKLISSAGKGFSQPVTKPEDCKKVMKHRAKLIECYAPDRRVDVDVYATRDAI